MPTRVQNVLRKTSPYQFQSVVPASPLHRRAFSTSRSLTIDRDGSKAGGNPAQSHASAGQGKLTHVSDTGSAHMVSISAKQSTSRVAIAACTVHFSNDTAPRLIRDNQMKKGDVLGVARVAGIMAAKRTADLIPLCHPIALSHVAMELHLRGTARSTGTAATASNTRAQAEGGEDSGPPRIEVRATVECDGKTGVEMEALVAASTAALTVYDMCKAVDKSMAVEGLRVMLKDGGKSGRWENE
jgi:cyclic pyranopterin phosphate synthase